jgi:hypothetical protein
MSIGMRKSRTSDGRTLDQLAAQLDAISTANATPLAAENTVNIGTGDGSTLEFAFPDSGVNRVDLVLVDGIPQPASVWSFTSTDLVFGAGNAPMTGLPVEVVAFTA